MLQDVRYGLRVLLQSKGWSAAVVLSLALGIGANTALFSATNALVLRTLPVSDPDSLVRLRHVGRNQMATDTSEYGYLPRSDEAPLGSTFPFAVFETLREANRTLIDLVAGAPLGAVNIVVDGHAEMATAYIASGNYQQLLGISPVLGRRLDVSDDRLDAVPVATISEGFWARRFGRSPDVLGSVVRANSVLVTIVGVTPASFPGIQRLATDTPADLVFPLALDTQLNPQPALPPGAPPLQPRMAQPTSWWLQIIGRLKPGATAAQVRANLDGAFQATAREGMASYRSSLSDAARESSQLRDRVSVPALQVSSAARGLYDADPTLVRAVTVISVVVGLILLLVGANIANLLLARTAVRQRDISVRLSLGASRARLIRQLLTESVLLALTGAALGMVVASWGRQLLPADLRTAPLDWRVTLFAAAVALATGILFGIAPALRVTAVRASESLAVGTRRVIGARTWLARGLLVAQVAISIVLLIGAGLFLRTVDNLRSVDIGFNPQRLVLFRLNPALTGYGPSRMEALYSQISERVAAVPGIRGVTLSNPALLAGGMNTTGFVVQGRPYAEGPQTIISRVRVAANFFEVIEMPLLRGRALSPTDSLTAPKVAVINEAAARKFFPGEDPLGRRFGGNPETSAEVEIVGLVKDAKYNSLREPAPATMYVPYLQSPLSAMTVEVRTAGDPALAMPAIREAVRQVDPMLPLVDLSSQDEQVERRFAQERVFARAYSLFGGLALLVASIGLFGLMSYSVVRRTREIGIRMALGAPRGTVLRMILRESLLLVSAGLVIGLGAAAGAGPLVASMLFGLSPLDPGTVATAVMLMLAVSAVAGYLPARRASRLEPLGALRHE